MKNNIGAYVIGFIQLCREFDTYMGLKVYEPDSLSILAKHLTDYISQKRALGFSFNLQAYWLYRFDRYCVDINLGTLSTNKELIDKWMKSVPNDSKHSKSSS